VGSSPTALTSNFNNLTKLLSEFASQESRLGSVWEAASTRGSEYNDPIERVTSREDRATLEASELSNQISMLARMVRARLLKALEAETLEEAHVKIDDAIDGLDTIIEMTPQAEPQEGQGDGA
jgi:hypothetical protein